MIPHAFPVSDIQQGPSDMKLQVETISLSEAIEAQGPHRRCGGRDIACAISARARRSTYLGVDTLCCLVFSAWTSFNDLGRFVWGKAFCPTGIGLVIDLLPIATQSQYVYIYIYIYMYVYIYIYIYIYIYVNICIYVYV